MGFGCSVNSFFMAFSTALARAEAERRRMLAKRRSELAGMQDRLLLWS